MSVQPRPGVANRAFCAAVSSGERTSRSPPRRAASTTGSCSSTAALWDRDVLGGSLLHAGAQGAPARAARTRSLPSRLLFVKQPERRAYGRRQRLFRLARRPGEERFFQLEVDHQEDLLGFDFAGALAGDGLPGRAGRPSAPRRLHARQARPVLREERAAALRRPAARDRAGLGLAVDARRAATASPATWSCSRTASTTAASSLSDVAGARSRRTAAGRVELERYRGRAAYTFPVQAAEHARSRVGRAAGHRRSRAARLPAERRRRLACPLPRPGRAPSTRWTSSPSSADEPVFLTCGAAEPQRAPPITRRPAHRRRQSRRSAGSPRGRAGGRGRAGPRRRGRRGAPRARNGSSASKQATTSAAACAGKRSSLPSKTSVEPSALVLEVGDHASRAARAASPGRAARAREAGRARPRGSAGACRGSACACAARRARGSSCAREPLGELVGLVGRPRSTPCRNASSCSSGFERAPLAASSHV